MDGEERDPGPSRMSVICLLFTCGLVRNQLEALGERLGRSQGAEKTGHSSRSVKPEEQHHPNAEGTFPQEASG